jgi:hypothetical protein
MIWTDSAIPNKLGRRKHALPFPALQAVGQAPIRFAQGRLRPPSLQKTGDSPVMSQHDCQTLLAEFRENLEAFYAELKLAPPYDSVEKTIRCLSDLFKTKTAEEQAQVLSDNALKWRLHVQAFVDSGLHKKHRGIITGLAHTDAFDRFPESLRYLLEPFRS